MKSIDRQLRQLQASDILPTLAGIRRGLEKESLRITEGGYLSERMHPRELGSALTHPHITTDYSEALMEFITPPAADLDAPLDFLTRIHQFVYRHLGDEILWGTSMPCMLTKEENVPIAYYGTSNIGRMKYIYRVGLGHRYGRYMQTIAGVHYNFSYPEEFWRRYQSLLGDDGDLQDFVSVRYFDLIRNYLRHVWMIPYLFGASPAMCSCFVKEPENSGLVELSRGTLYAPHATSLRLGDLGYQNNAQASLRVSYNSLAEYVKGLEMAIRTPEPAYQVIGVRDADGSYRQLNASVLQVENEYYATIRPKRPPMKGERPALALHRRGVEYVEVRSLDLNPFEPNGVSAESLAFLDCLLLYCLLQDSPPLTEDERKRCRENLSLVVNRGREPGLMLSDGARHLPLADWGIALTEEMRPVAEILDEVYASDRFSRALAAQQAKFRSPDATLSARLLSAVSEQQLSFFGFARQLSQQHKQMLLREPLADDVAREFQALAATSLTEQAQIEAGDDIDFETFLANYYR